MPLPTFGRHPKGLLALAGSENLHNRWISFSTAGQRDFDVYETRIALNTFLLDAKTILFFTSDLPEVNIDAIVDQVGTAYDDFMRTKLNGKNITLAIGRLKKQFCKPPEGGLQPPPGPKDPDRNDDDSGKVLADLADKAESVSKLAVFCAKVYGWIHGVPVADAFAKQEQKVLSLLSVLLMVSFCDRLNLEPDERLAPAKNKPRPVVSFAGGGRRNQDEDM